MVIVNHRAITKKITRKLQLKKKMKRKLKWYARKYQFNTKEGSDGEIEGKYIGYIYKTNSKKSNMNPTLSVILNVNIQDTNQKAEADQMDFLKKNN